MGVYRSDREAAATVNETSLPATTTSENGTVEQPVDHALRDALSRYKHRNTGELRLLLDSRSCCIEFQRDQFWCLYIACLNMPFLSLKYCSFTIGGGSRTICFELSGSPPSF